MPSSLKTKTDLIFTSHCPWDNPYQGEDLRVLFICSAGLLRSATGARIYSGMYNTRAAGSEPYALIPVSDSLILWAEQIVFVSKENYESVKRRYDLSEHNVVVLDIPDKYDHMNPKLIQAFEEQYESIE